MNIVQLETRNKAQPYQPTHRNYGIGRHPVESDWKFARQQSSDMREAELIQTPAISPRLRTYLIICAAITVAIVAGVVFGGDAWQWWVS